MPAFIRRPTPFPIVVTFVSRVFVEPPAKNTPLPLKPLITRVFDTVADENTTLLTFAPIVSPFEPGFVPVPSSVTASSTVTLVAAASVRPLSGVAPPTGPENAIARPAERFSRLAPSTADVNTIPVPAVSAVSFSIATAPVYF